MYTGKCEKKPATLLDMDMQRYSVDLVLALGKPKEKVTTVPVGLSENIRDYRDEHQMHYVPKWSLEELLIW